MQQAVTEWTGSTLTRHETSAIAEKPAWRHVAGHSMHCLRDIRLRTIGWPWNWGWGHWTSLKVPPFNSMGMVSYSNSIATMAVTRTVSEIPGTPTYSTKIAQFCLVFGAPIRGEAVRIKQWPLVTKHWWGYQVSACVIFILHQKTQKMAKCTFWYQLTRVVLDKVWRAVCVCVCFDTKHVWHTHTHTDRRKCRSIYPQ